MESQVNRLVFRMDWFFVFLLFHRIGKLFPKSLIHTFQLPAGDFFLLLLSFTGIGKGGSALLTLTPTGCIVSVTGINCHYFNLAHRKLTEMLICVCWLYGTFCFVVFGWIPETVLVDTNYAFATIYNSDSLSINHLQYLKFRSIINSCLHIRYRIFIRMYSI